MTNFKGQYIQDIASLGAVRKMLILATKDYYPNFAKWWDTRVLAGIPSGQRFVFCVFDNQTIAGCMVLKKCASEKKICTLYVVPEYRYRTIGTFMLTVATSILGPTPIITIPESVVGEYGNLLQSFGFIKTNELPDYYVDGMTEIVYNDFTKKNDQEF